MVVLPGIIVNHCRYQREHQYPVINRIHAPSSYAPKRRLVALTVSMTKCRLQVSTPAITMNTIAIRLKTLFSGDVQAWSATMKAIITSRMIRTSRIQNQGSPIGSSGDFKRMQYKDKRSKG